VSDLAIIIPVKDEEDGLRFLHDDFRKSSLGKEYDILFIFVIDERTNDESKKIASFFSEEIIDQSKTTGKGAAIKQAVRSWANNPTRLVVFLDADGSYSFDSVRKLVNALENGADVASGSRFLSSGRRPSGMTRLHNFGNRGLSLFSSFRNRRRITDLCTGLWGFKRESLEMMRIKSNGFDLEAELAGLSRKNRLKHIEVPVDWSQRKGGTSKLRSLRDGLIIFIRILIT
jgi:dolichol-phosphate mannosyltransferase|tara:strand:- start:1946 stop:2635 length:690 start_codon:yes stop_codon:yes gene_type:complete